MENVFAYETITILKPSASETQATELGDRIRGIISQHQGTHILTDAWGKKKLAFPIERSDYGVYHYHCYTGNNTLVAEIERNLRNNENIVRFMTVKLESKTAPDVEAIKKAYTEANWPTRIIAREQSERPRRSFHDDDDHGMHMGGDDE